MNILVIYTKYPGALGEYWIKTLQKMGHGASGFDSQLAPRWINLSGISVPLGRNISILDVVKKSNPAPDLVIHVDGALRCLSDLKKLNIPKVFYAIDSHLTPGFHKNIIPDFDVVFSAQKDCVPMLKKVKDEVFWLPLAIDTAVHKKYEATRLFDVGFVGRMDPMYASRTGLLKKLSTKYDVLAANDYLRYTNVPKIYSQCRIGFNKSLRGDLNLRVFEVMACGTMLLTDRINTGIEELFIDKKHLVLYNDEREMLELAGYYLENEDERERIAREGQKEVLDKHTHEHRIKEIFRVIEKYI